MDETNKDKKGCFVSSKNEETAAAERMLVIVIMGTLILAFFRLFGCY